MPSFSYEKSIISSPRPSAMPRCGGSPCALLTRKRIIFSFRYSLAKGMFTGISMVLNSLSNVRAMARRGQAPNLIRQLPRRRHLRLVRLLGLILEHCSDLSDSKRRCSHMRYRVTVRTKRAKILYWIDDVASSHL